MLHTIPLKNSDNWQSTLSDLVTDPNELLRLLELEAADLGLAEQALRDFPLRVPRPFLARMEKGNPADPLLRQVLPLAEEDMEVNGFSTDPLQEAAANPAPGILHKYYGRALLLPTSSCAIHCRYCFRRHFPYQDNIPDRQSWQLSLDYLRRSKDIEEVILSGGDPLAIADRHLDWLLSALEAIPHVHTLRLHTRLPIMIPARVSQTLCQRLENSRLRVVIVLHCNHAREIDAGVEAACRDLIQSGAMLLNQSVLLKGINDGLEPLAELSRALFKAGVLPYYLHLLDRTRGTAHFEVEEARGVAILDELRHHLPGYLVPRLAREEPGAGAKTLIPLPDPP